MEVRLLGPIDVMVQGSPCAPTGTKVRGVLALLALEAGRTVGRERLLDAVWGDADHVSANAIQVAVAKLRRMLGDLGEADRLVSGSAGYALAVSPEEVDALRFERMAGDQEQLPRALALWRGPALADAPETEPIRALRVRFEEMRLVAEEAHAEDLLGREDPAAVVPDLVRLVDAEPLRERRWALLMRAQYGAGQQADALRTFARARALLIDAIGVEPGSELRDLEAGVLAQDDAAVLGRASRSRAPLGTAFRRHGNLQHPIGRLVGRAGDIERLERVLAQHRLVTLTGPGGVGKTRLALELGRTQEPDAPDGVWFANLTSARDAHDVALAVLRALGLDDVRPADALDAAGAALADRSAVVILDNCEHVLQAAAAFATHLLGRCGDLKVLATSREPLAVPGEIVVPVGPLSLEEATTLFDERTAGLALTDADPEVVARICERLDRLPLAIELAAGRARHLPLSDLLERLAAPLAVLGGASSRAEPDRRGLRGVAEWSYRLLEPLERAVFEILGVFADGATIDAAVTVGTSLGLPPHDIESVLHRLVDKSLVWVEGGRATPRYRMLQTLYDFARERLGARDDLHAVYAAHARWVMDLAATVRFGERTTGATVATVLDEDVAIRDALHWATLEEPGLAIEIVTALAPFWFGSMRVSTGWDLMSTVLESTSRVHNPDRLTAAAWAGLFATMAFDAAASERFDAEITAGVIASEDPFRQGIVALTRALACGYRSEGGRGHEWAARARTAFATARDPIGTSHVDFAEGALYLVEGATVAAGDRLSDAIDGFRLHGDHLGLILALSRLGELAWRTGDIDRFLDAHREMRDLGRASRTAGVVAGATARLAMGHLIRGEIDVAEDLARDALASCGASYMPVVNGFAFRSAALVDIARGHVDAGHRGLRAAIDAFERGAGQVGTGYAVLCRVDLARSLAASGDDAAARIEATAAVASAEPVGDPWVTAHAVTALGELAPPT